MEEESLESPPPVVETTSKVIREYSDFPTAPVIEPPATEHIGGWLILVAFGLLFAAARFVLLTVRDFLPLFKGETWSALTTIGSSAYHPHWAPLLVGEMVGDSLFALFALVLFVLLLMRKSSFPNLMILYLLANLAFVVGDYFAGLTIPAIAQEAQMEPIREMVASMAGVIIWVPYFLISERAKRTFLL